ncbi:MAG: TAXI family TRAP transporter solute-binding subunit [Phycisphaerales bacterium]
MIAVTVKQRKRLILGGGAAGLIVVLLVLLWPSRNECPDQLVIATATEGGTYFDVGEDFARILGELDSPIIATADSSAGSFENIDRLKDNDAHLALVAGPALGQGNIGGIRVLAYLYDDVVQLVVRKEANIDSLDKLAHKNIYIGSEKSSTRLIAESLLKSIGLDEEDYNGFPVISKADSADEADQDVPEQTEAAPDEWSYSDAADKLITGELDAAIFSAGTPTNAVGKALDAGCVVLSLEDQLEGILSDLADLQSEEVLLPARSYEKQEEPVMTIGTPVFLVCRRGLSDDLVGQILDGLFDNIGEMLREHTRDEIRLQDAFSRLPKGIKRHPGAVRFERREQDKLWILTGAIGGTYYQFGKEIAVLLNEEGEEGIETRVIHTHGSIQNARMLQNGEHPAVAIMQYDVALSALKGSAKSVYKRGVDEFTDIDVEELHRIATLHEERVFIVASRKGKIASADGRPTVEALEGKKVGIGPKDSGTWPLAKAILAWHEVEPKTEVEAPVEVMVRQLRNGQLDAAIFVSGLPSEPLKKLFSDTGFRLLSVDPKRIESLTRRSVLHIVTIETDPEEFSCQLDGELSIETLATRAVLVATTDLPDVDNITRAIFNGAGFITIVPDAQTTMQMPLPSLTLHPEAKKVYQELDFIQEAPKLSFLEWTAHLLAILVIVFAASRGSRTVWREWMSNSIKDQVLSISLKLDEADSVRRLIVVRGEARRRARLPWWHVSQLDRHRWHDLEEIIDHRIQEARSRRTSALLAEARSLVDGDKPFAAERALSLKKEAWRLTEVGELVADQLDLVLRALGDERSGSTLDEHSPGGTRT